MGILHYEPVTFRSTFTRGIVENHEVTSAERVHFAHHI
jgi:hypothetical protein